jgi:anti-anti-sigma regulatory factor
MSDKIINISELFSSHSLVTRQAARDLFALISHMPDNSIILDLSQIDFASRSFFDELNSYESKFRLLGKKVEIININDNLISLLQLVKERAKTMSSISYESIANAKVITI